MMVQGKHSIEDLSVAGGRHKNKLYYNIHGAHSGPRMVRMMPLKTTIVHNCKTRLMNIDRGSDNPELGIVTTPLRKSFEI